MFSVHPGLLPIGMTETLAGTAPSTHYEDHVRRWAMTELKEARGAETDEAVELLLRVAAGDADALSGRHLSVHDDLDAMLARRARGTAGRPLCAAPGAPAPGTSALERHRPARLTGYWDSQIMASRSGASSRTP